MTRKPDFADPAMQPRARDPIPILFVHYGDDWIRGSEQVLLDLIAGLDHARFPPLVWCNAPAMEAAVARLGVPVVRSDFAYYFDYSSPRFSPARYLSLVRQGVRLVRRHRARVIHANGAAPHQWMLPAARLARVPVLAHLHIEYLRRSRTVCLLKHADRLVGVSQAVLAAFAADGMPAGRMTVIPNGIDFARFVPAERGEARRALGIAADRLVIAAVGSLIKRKGHDILLRAFAPLAHASGALLLIAGDGPERDALIRLAGELGIGEHVRLLGERDRWTELPAVYAASDIVALASRSDGAGLGLVEAGHFGCPVVATRTGGIPEVVEEGVTGLLVPPEDAGALGAALAALAGDPDLRARVGRAGRGRAEAEFSAQLMARRFAEMCGEVAFPAIR